MTRLPVTEVEERLQRNILPCVVISDGGFDYEEICQKYKACYIHSTIPISEFGINTETLPVLLNRICLSAAALNVDRIVYFVNCCESFVIGKDIVINKIAPCKFVVEQHFKNHKNIELHDLTNFFKSL